MRRSKDRPSSRQRGKVVGRKPGELEALDDAQWAELALRADLLRATGGESLKRSAAVRLGRRLGVHWTTVYRWRTRLRETELLTGLQDRKRGFPGRRARLSARQDEVLGEVICSRLASHKLVRIVDLLEEVTRRFAKEGIQAPHRSTVTRRWRRALLERQAERSAPGSYRVRSPLDVVQIDHTVSDVIVVDELYRAPIGRPYLTVALDVATRSVLAAMLGFNPPSAATVALCLARVASPKDRWLQELELSFDWPMYGLPRSIHLDNAPEFHSKALSRGCAQFGIELIYRPPGRPHFGGHVERSIGTLMRRFQRLPGATGPSTRDRKARQAEKSATMTLRELETWLAVEIGERYHHHPHRGLQQATPYAAWAAHPPPPPPAERLEALAWAFLPAVERKVRRDGIHFHNIAYWHPVFSQWALGRRSVLVHYDPRDISRLHVRSDAGEVLQVGYADIRHPPISLWECEAAAAHLRSLGDPVVREAKLFAAIETQRQLVRKAAARTRAARAKQARQPHRDPVPARARPGRPLEKEPENADQTQDPDTSHYPGEVW